MRVRCPWHSGRDVVMPGSPVPVRGLFERREVGISPCPPGCRADERSARAVGPPDGASQGSGDRRSIAGRTPPGSPPAGATPGPDRPVAGRPRRANLPARALAAEGGPGSNSQGPCSTKRESGLVAQARKVHPRRYERLLGGIASIGLIATGSISARRSMSGARVATRAPNASASPRRALVIEGLVRGYLADDLCQFHGSRLVRLPLQVRRPGGLPVRPLFGVLPLRAPRARWRGRLLGSIDPQHPLASRGPDEPMVFDAPTPGPKRRPRPKKRKFSDPGGATRSGSSAIGRGSCRSCSRPRVDVRAAGLGAPPGPDQRADPDDRHPEQRRHQRRRRVRGAAAGVSGQRARSRPTSPAPAGAGSGCRTGRRRTGRAWSSRHSPS